MRNLPNILPQLNFQVLEMFPAFPVFLVFLGKKGGKFGKQLISTALAVVYSKV